MTKHPDKAKDILGFSFSKLRSMNALPCFFNSELMIRESKYQVQGVRLKKLVFYNIISGDVEEVFNSIPEKQLYYNNRDFIYSLINRETLHIFDMGCKMEWKHKLDTETLEIAYNKNCKILRICRES